MTARKLTVLHTRKWAYAWAAGASALMLVGDGARCFAQERISGSGGMSLSTCEGSEVDATDLPVLAPSEPARCLVSRSSQWTASLDGTGLVLTPLSGEWDFALRFNGYSMGDNECAAAQPASATFTASGATYYWDDFLVEWYEQDSHGIEHGFTVQASPESTCSDTLRLGLTFHTSRIDGVWGSPQCLSFEDEQHRPVITYSGLIAFDARGVRLPATMEPAGDGLTIVVHTTDAIYPIVIDPVVQRMNLTPSNLGYYFGMSTGVDGDTVVVGAYQEACTSTGVDGPQDVYNSPGAGSSYVYNRTLGIWAQQAYVKASNTDAQDWFGASVAISGDTIAIGAPGESSNSVGSTGNQSDNNAPSSGAVYVFVRSGATWTQQAYLKASNTDSGDGFGWCVSISGDTLVVGAPFEASASTGVNGNQADNSAGIRGAAYVFVRVGSQWAQEAYLKPSNLGPLFGSAVAISGNTIVVGAPWESSPSAGINGPQTPYTTPNAGAAYVFSRNGVIWAQEAYVKASNPSPTGLFGTSVAIRDDTIVIGAPGDASSATGVNGNQALTNSQSSGAAYVFSRLLNTWTQTAYLKASNTGAFDEFGTSVSVDGNTIIVGASREDGGYGGVGGNGMDNSLQSSGAAYVFDRIGGQWTAGAYLKAFNPIYNVHYGQSVGVSGQTIIVGTESSGVVSTYDNIPQPVATCFGDGSGAPCPCGNNGLPGHGCANSLVGSSGGTLQATGLARVSADTLVLTSTGVRDGPGLYYQGSTTLNGGLGVPFGDGLRCAGGAVVRLGIAVATAGTSVFPTNSAPFNVPLSIAGGATPGSALTYQLWYRDSATYCTPSTFNLTNGLRVVWSF